MPRRIDEEEEFQPGVVGTAIGEVTPTMSPGPTGRQLTYGGMIPTYAGTERPNITKDYLQRMGYGLGRTPEMYGVPGAGGIISDLSGKITQNVLAKSQPSYDIPLLQNRAKPVPIAPVVQTGAVNYTGPEGTLTAGPPVTGDVSARQRTFAQADQTRRGLTEELISQEYRVAMPGGGYITETPRESEMRRQRSDEAMAELETQKELGIVPRTGMAEYEANARRMKEEGALEAQLATVSPKSRAGVVSDFMQTQAEVQKERIGAVTAREKAGAAERISATQQLLKGQVESAKLGLQAQDVQSKIALRRTQMDDMAARTGLLEPMKLQLQQAKTSQEANRIRREGYEKAITTVYKEAMSEWKSRHQMGMAGEEGKLDPTAQAEYNKINQAYLKNLLENRLQHPEENQVERLPDGQMIKFSGGKWIDVKQGIIASE